MIYPAPRPVSYYPLETADSYVRRLCTANHMDLAPVKQALHEGCVHMRTHDRTETLVQRCEQLGGLAAGTIAREDDSTGLTPRPNCHQCDRTDRPRWMCVQCAQGQQVEQVRHHRTTICLKHRRWAGPGTAPHHHVRVDHPELIHAERTFRRHALGRCATNVIAARTIAADWALHTDPGCVARRRETLRLHHVPDDIEAEVVSYPEAVALMTVFADSTWLQDLLHTTRAHDTIRAAVTERIAAVIPEHPDHAAAVVMRELRPAIARYFHTHGAYRRYSHYPDNPAIPVWHHDVEITI